MVGIVSILVHWVALSHFGQNIYPPKSHWSLLSELQQLPEEDLEDFLPQLCNILLDRDSEDAYGLYDHFEEVLLDKCAKCLPFGLRVYGLLKVIRQKNKKYVIHDYSYDVGNFGRTF